MKPGINIGGIIRAMRKGAGMSQIELSEAVGVTQGYLSRVERNELPDPGILCLIQMVVAIDAHLKKCIPVDDS
jgi:transcriptional regulator with XRE-family HTH domain